MQKEAISAAVPGSCHKKSLAGKPVPVEITVYKDKKFDFIIKSPPASHFIREAAKLKSGSKEPGRVVAGSITIKQAEAIAKEKMKDLNAFDFGDLILFCVKLFEDHKDIREIYQNNFGDYYCTIRFDTYDSFNC